MSELTFQELPLAEPIQRALSDKGYTTPSPIQARAIPVLLEGGDLLACAQTGTGKTAAFALPLLHGIAERPRKPFRRGVRHLVLTPTRELAVQVAENFELYGKHIKFRSMMVYGGVSEKPQIKTLFQGVDVLVACPGRLIDLMDQGHVDLSQVETFILDEADRMLDMGFIRDIRKIAAKLPKKRQTLLFSATMAPEITKLGHAMLHQPAEIRIAPQGTTADKVDQSLCFIGKKAKPKLLLEMLHRRFDEQPNELSLVFTRTKHGAKNLAKKLNGEGLKADAIHGNKSQSAREKTLERYRRGEIDILVATDVAARGIDVKNITLVINFDLPMEADAYVHRIGRTARAGASGHAVSFCSEEEVALLRQIERLIKKTVPVDESHPFHDADAMELHLSRRPVKKPAQGGGNRGGGGRSGAKRGGPRKSSPGKFKQGGRSKPSAGRERAKSSEMRPKARPAKRNSNRSRSR
ncbi:DEAD/DEAH box helicase [Coraliomargarita akajimensis]|uniref:DEAD-box ATP-dependent RNA helicase RhpA n=1 Tax=Coraliomargarita akajimensis (strain DSM 45221 / IAM 15411 / JCM 23193 / KCTC 12865 / 04OKA010-24) TaxID=583355 RepID=D5EQL9_CORAD|nr:DEAD/DEAH box helicase [Coraliomargarita akajimensis]ADE55833.1 DEAD/DEAH box helicase domain protein [Coraliomargarita akajimensis DSM 45221]